MKNIILTLVIIFSSFSVKSQNVIFYDSTYFFTHDKNVSTMDAIENKSVSWYGFTDDTQKFVIDTINKTILVYDYNNKLVVKERITKYFSIGDEFVYQFNGVMYGSLYFVGELIFTKSKREKDMVVCKLMYNSEPDKYYCYMGYIKKGVN
jgi:hypothetical protein